MADGGYDIPLDASLRQPSHVGGIVAVAMRERSPSGELVPTAVRRATAIRQREKLAGTAGAVKEIRRIYRARALDVGVPDTRGPRQRAIRQWPIPWQHRNASTSICPCWTKWGAGF